MCVCACVKRSLLVLSCTPIHLPIYTTPIPQEPTPKLSHTLLQRLQTVVEEFLQGSYAILMTQLRKELQPGLHVSRLDRDDFVRFLRLTRFFHQYVRLKTVCGIVHVDAIGVYGCAWV